MNWILKTYSKYRELIMYAITGVGATLINTVAYIILADLVGINYVVSNIIAWILAFIFAFYSNKIWVFESNSHDVKKTVIEFIEFGTARLSTGILDTLLMVLFVSILNINDVLSKIVVNIIIIIINYLASKFIIFKKTNEDN